MSEPAWLAYARTQIGVREIPGPRHAPAIMAMVKRATQAGWLGFNVTSDEVPWCGTFVADCLRHAGFRPPRGFVGVRARAYEKWGEPLSLTATRPPLGAIGVMTREGGGHVLFVTGVFDNGDIWGLGGNQENEVNERRFKRGRFTAFRWPPGVPLAPASPWRGGHGPISRNEA